MIVSINASYLTASRTFDDTRTFDLYSETASFTSDYAVEPSVGVDAGAIVRIWKGLGAGVAFTSYSDSRDIEIEASLPHPLKFNSPRTHHGDGGRRPRGDGGPPPVRLHRADRQRRCRR